MRRLDNYKYSAAEFYYAPQHVFELFSEEFEKILLVSSFVYSFRACLIRL
jgi:hypothetical protein